jgi:hypothetical protein
VGRHKYPKTVGGKKGTAGKSEKKKHKGSSKKKGAVTRVFLLFVYACKSVDLSVFLIGLFS